MIIHIQTSKFGSQFLDAHLVHNTRRDERNERKKDKLHSNSIDRIIFVQIYKMFFVLFSVLFFFFIVQTNEINELCS